MTPMSEDELLRSVIDACRTLGLRTVHFRPALTQTGKWRTPVQGDGKGWPDLTIVGPGGILFRELKAERGATTPEQRQWISWLTEAGCNVAVWKPRDWHSGRIITELKALHRPSRALPAVASA